MASKRDLKKQIHYTIYDIIDESYSIQLYDASKATQSDKIIDKAVELQDSLLSRICKARSKQEIRSVISDLQEQTQAMYEEMDQLQ